MRLGPIVVVALILLAPLAIATTSDLVKLADPTTPVSSTPQAGEWSPTETHLAIGSTSSPFLYVYAASGSGASTTLTKLADPSSLPTNSCYVDWKPSGDYLLCSQSATSPFVTLYQFSGTGASATLTKCANPGSLPLSAAGGRIGSASMWSPQGDYFSIVGGSNAALYYVQGCTMTKTGSLLSGVGTPVQSCWSHDGTVIVGTTSSSPYVYPRTLTGTRDSTVSFTAWSAMPAAAGQVSYCEWSPDDSMMVAVSCTGTSIVQFKVYAMDKTSRSATLLTDSSGLVSTCVGANQVSWSSNNVLAISSFASPRFTTFTRSGSTIVQGGSPDTIPAASVSYLEWSPNSNFVAEISTAAPRIGVYEYDSSSKSLTRLTPDPSTLPPEASSFLEWGPIGRFISTGLISTSPRFYTYSTALGVASISSNARITVRNCLDPNPNANGQCAQPGAPAPNVTYSISGASTTSQTGASGTTGNDGIIPIRVTGNGLTWVNLTSTAPDVYAPTQIVYLALPSNTNATVYVWQRSAYCSPSSQNITVPAQAVFNYSVTQSGTQAFYTIFKQDAGTGIVTSRTPSYQLTNSLGTLTYPPVPSQNGSAGQLQNDTGAYLLAISDGLGKPIAVCTFQIQTTGTAFGPILVDDFINATITQTMTNSIAAFRLQHIDQQAQSIDAISDFAAWSWRKPLLEFYAFFGMDISGNSAHGVGYDLLIFVGNVPWFLWGIALSAVFSLLALSFRKKVKP